MKLVQKKFLKGSKEFELTDDMVIVRTKKLLKEETLTVMLTILNPEPVVNDGCLEFHSRVKCDPLLSLLIDKPDERKFNAFVDELKQRARQAYNAFAGLKTGAFEGLAGNVYAEPPDFDTTNQNGRKSKPVDAGKIDTALQMLKQYLDEDDIKSLLAALEAVAKEPQNEECFNQLVKAFDRLGPHQGAVLTYAPYVGLLLSDGPSRY